MTAQEMYLRRLMEIRKPKRASIGASLGGEGAAPVTADQGPTQAGGILGQGTRPVTQVPGRRRMSIGNASRGNIDLGSFMSARENPEAAAQLAANPLADVDRFKPTSGVGGFFRSLLGDDANERNDFDRAQRQELLRQKYLMDQQNAGRMGIVDKEHQLGLERINTEAKLRAEQQQALFGQQTQLARMGDQNALNLEGMRSVNDLIRQTAGQQATARENALNRATTERGQDLTSEAAALRAMMSQREQPSLRVYNDGGIIERNGQLFSRDEMTGAYGPLNLGGSSAPSGGFTLEQQAAIKAEAQAKVMQNSIAEAQQPPSVTGGISQMAGAIPNPAMLPAAAANALYDISPAKPAVNALIQQGRNMIDPIKQYLLNLDAEKKRRQLEQLGATNSIPSIR